MSWIHQSIKTDCRYYVGEKPCKFKVNCVNCTHYSPMGKRILVIKLGAAGDALRTTPILRTFQEKFGRHHVTWVTDAVSYELLKGNPFIDSLLLLTEETARSLSFQKFDILYSVDKALPASSLASFIHAEKKCGFYINQNGSLDVFDEKGAYALLLGIDDPLKFERNKKTYQEITFDMLDLPWQGQEYIFTLLESERKLAADKLKSMDAVKRPLIGLNTGAGEIFATKKWPAENFVELARLINEKFNCTLLIMGGPGETEINQRILFETGPTAIDVGCDNPVRIFAGMVADLDVLVTADTLAMHLGIAAKVPTVALFGPTAHAEVSLYDRGEKLEGKTDCSPCYRSECNQEQVDACMKAITPQQVLDALEKLLSDRAKSL